MAGGKEQVYLVRGAQLCCRMGSHPRRLNLPQSHGEYICGRPVIMDEDCTLENISWCMRQSESAKGCGPGKVCRLYGGAAGGSGDAVRPVNPEKVGEHQRPGGYNGFLSCVCLRRDYRAHDFGNGV